MEKTKDKKIYYSMAGALLFILAVLILSITLYIRKFDRTLAEENQAHLAELAGYTVNYTRSVIEDLQGALENAAGAVSVLQEDKRLEYLDDMVHRQGFAFAGYAKKDGSLHTTDKTQDMQAAKEEYYIEAMKGNNTVTNLTRRILTNRAVSGIILAVPLRNEAGEAEGVLMALMEIERLNDALGVESFGGHGYSYIIDQEGSLILHSKSMDYNNFYRVLGNVQIKTGETLEQIKRNIDSGGSGMMEYEQLGNSRYAYYCPLGLNSWTIVNIVSKEAVTQKTDVLTRELIILSVSVFAVFAALFIIAGISWINSQNRRHAAETKSTFLANVSHEIRTPMNAIVGMSEILMRGNLDRRQEECVRCIQDSGKSLISIINDILDISKIESGKFTIQNGEYNLRSLLSDITAMAVIRIGNEPIRFWAEIDQSVPERMKGDRTRLQQIIVNLIGNAVKFTEQGYIKMSVSTQEMDGEIYLQIKITDTGIGIKKQDMDQLFISFNQVDLNKNYGKEGTGLGLAIARSLSQMMGGDITVESEYGKGSVFTMTVEQESVGARSILEVKGAGKRKILILEKDEECRKYFEKALQQMNLPYHICARKEEFESALHSGEYKCVLGDKITVEELLSDPVAANIWVGVLVKQEEYLMPAENIQNFTVFVPLFSFQLLRLLETYSSGEQSEEISDVFRPLSEARLLIVDDNRLNLEIAESLLEPYQMEIDCVTSGKEAIQAVQDKDYDMILMDHMMPEMDGTEALKKIRSLSGEKYKTIPIVVLTANAVDGAREMFLEHGFNGFLTKPIDMHEMNRILERWVRKE